VTRTVGVKFARVHSVTHDPIGGVVLLILMLRTSFIQFNIERCIELLVPSSPPTRTHILSQSRSQKDMQREGPDQAWMK
jgi:hypothetical protein